MLFVSSDFIFRSTSVFSSLDSYQSSPVPPILYVFILPLCLNSDSSVYFSFAVFKCITNRRSGDEYCKQLDRLPFARDGVNSSSNSARLSQSYVFFSSLLFSDFIFCCLLRLISFSDLRRYPHSPTAISRTRYDPIFIRFRCLCRFIQ